MAIASPTAAHRPLFPDAETRVVPVPGLPALRGVSEKQIRAGERCRDGKLPYLRQAVREARRLAETREAQGAVDAGECRERADRWARRLGQIERTTSAKWWIEHQKTLPTALLEGMETR